MKSTQNLSLSVTSKQLSDDDSSSLGYGSAHSSTYSNSNCTPNEDNSLEDYYRDAEFYDLESVKNFSFVTDDIGPGKNCENTTTQTRKVDYSLDIDEVEPSEELTKIINSSTVSFISNNVDNSLTRLKLLEREIYKRNRRLMTREENVYEEIANDSSVINLTGLEPPPLPRRNKFHFAKHF